MPFAENWAGAPASVPPLRGSGSDPHHLKRERKRRRPTEESATAVAQLCCLVHRTSFSLLTQSSVSVFRSRIEQPILISSSKGVCSTNALSYLPVCLRKGWRRGSSKTEHCSSPDSPPTTLTLPLPLRFIDFSIFCSASLLASACFFLCEHHSKRNTTATKRMRPMVKTIGLTGLLWSAVASNGSRARLERTFNFVPLLKTMRPLAASTSNPTRFFYSWSSDFSPLAGHRKAGSRRTAGKAVMSTRTINSYISTAFAAVAHWLSSVLFLILFLPLAISLTPYTRTFAASLDSMSAAFFLTAHG